jgi:hypothetical protein
LSDELSGTYPITVFSAVDSGTARQYKVMVGPLNQDESGVLLAIFRARGYRDAFIRRGDG